jgi:hypothetical protein
LTLNIFSARIKTFFGGEGGLRNGGTDQCTDGS